MTRSTHSRFGIAAIFALVILVNYLSNALPINGITMSQMSAKYSTLFTPAGFTFAIWGVIYLALFGFVIFQAMPSQKDSQKIARITVPFIVNGVANAAWIVVWHYDMIMLAFGIMLVILGSLIVIYRRLREGTATRTLLERIFLFLPFSLYLAWITAATIANFSILQVDLGLESFGLSELNWTYLKLAVAAAIGTIMLLRGGDIAFILVIAWAAFGIASKQAGTPLISGAATILSLLGIVLAVFEVIRRGISSVKL